MNAGSRTVRAGWVVGVFSLASLSSLCAAEVAATAPSLPAGKPRISVMRFEAEGNVPPHLGSFLYNALTDRFVASDAFVVVDWEQIHGVLGFIQKSQPNLSTEDARRQAINQQGVEKLYLGSLNKVGRKYYLLVKVLNFDLTVERTERETVSSENELEQAVIRLADRLVLPRAKMSWERGTYDGCVSDGKPQGEGTLRYEGRDGLDRYEGQWKDGKRHGHGTLYYAPGNRWKIVRYEGEWQNGEANGEGTLCWESGDKYVGQLREGFQNGHGTLYYISGAREEGLWKNGKLEGQTELSTSQDDKAIGLCVKGKKEGAWTVYHRSSVLGEKVYADDRLASQTAAVD